MVQHITELTRTLLECEYVSVVLVEPKRDKLRLVSIAGASKEQEHNWFKMVANLFLHEALDAGALSRLRGGEVLQPSQTQPLLQAMCPSNMQKVMIAPIRLHEQFMGMLILHSDARKHKYSLQEKKAIAEIVGTFIASIIAREHLANERVAAVQANAQSLDAIDQRMNDFLSAVSHELRTPLTAMKSNIWFATNLLTDVLQQVQEEEISLRSLIEDIRELLYRVDQLVGVQNQMVSELLDISRIQMSKLDLRFQPYNLITIVRQIVEQFTSATSTNRLRVIGGEKSLPVLVDGDRIGQVLTNYLTNALTYSASDCPVEIHVQVQGQQARVSVHDVGPGLSSEEQEHVWERFYRVPRVVAQAHSRRGLGIGLYLCRMIIEHHQGQVGVESVVGKGSTFWFTLPLLIFH